MSEIEARPGGSGPGEGRRSFVGPILAGVVFLLALAGLWFGKSHPAPEAPEPEADIVVTVRTVNAVRGAIAETATAVGTLFARRQATISARISAQIREMALLRNQTVKAGEVIAVLESIDFSQSTAQAEKELSAARAEAAAVQKLVERRRTLFEQGGIARKELEASELELSNAEASLKLAQRNLEILSGEGRSSDDKAGVAGSGRSQAAVATVRAPFGGVITDQFQFKGEFVSAGSKLVDLADLSEVIVKVPFPDLVVARLQEGDDATVIPSDRPELHLTGRISLISRVADPLSRTVEVWVSLPNQDGRLRPGTAARVTVTSRGVGDAVVVPESAVTLEATTGNVGTVMVVDGDSIAHETRVTVGIRNPPRIQVLEGLKGGERVVVEGNYALPDGTKVRIADTDGAAGEKAGEGSSGSGEQRSPESGMQDSSGSGDRREDRKEAGGRP